MLSSDYQEPCMEGGAEHGRLLWRFVSQLRMK